MAGKSTGCDHPKAKDIYTHVIPHIPANKWEDLGLELLDEDTAATELSHIKASIPDTNQRCKAVFEKWLLRRSATWNELIAALEKVELTFLADSIKKILSSITGDVLPAEHTKSEITNAHLITKAEEASAEFGFLLSEILKVLMKNKEENLTLLKSICSTLTIKNNSKVPIFSDEELKIIMTSTDIQYLFLVELRKYWRWDDFSVLSVIVASLNSKKCELLLVQFEKKVDARIKLNEIYEHCKKQNDFPKGFHKMVVITNKLFSDITKKEYDELKSFVSRHCGVEPYAISPFVKAASSSVILEWYIPGAAVAYMIEIASLNKQLFGIHDVVYLKITASVIFDRRKNVRIKVDVLDSAGVASSTTLGYSSTEHGGLYMTRQLLPRSITRMLRKSQSYGSYDSGYSSTSSHSSYKELYMFKFRDLRRFLNIIANQIDLPAVALILAADEVIELTFAQELLQFTGGVREKGLTVLVIFDQLQRQEDRIPFFLKSLLNSGENSPTNRELYERLSSELNFSDSDVEDACRNIVRWRSWRAPKIEKGSESSSSGSKTSTSIGKFSSPQSYMSESISGYDTLAAANPTHSPADQLTNLQEENTRLQQKVGRLHLLTETQGNVVNVQTQLKAFYYKRHGRSKPTTKISPATQTTLRGEIRTSRSLDSILHELARLQLEEQATTKMSRSVSTQLPMTKSPRLHWVTKEHKYS